MLRLENRLPFSSLQTRRTATHRDEKRVKSLERPDLNVPVEDPVCVLEHPEETGQGRVERERQGEGETPSEPLRGVRDRDVHGEFSSSELV